MKNFLKKLAITTLTFAIMLICLASCDIVGQGQSSNGDNGDTNTETPPEKVVYSLVLEADKTDAARGDKITFSAALKADGEEDIPSVDTEYTIVSGSEYASFTGNILTVLDTAPHGAAIKVQAVEGATKSNEITVSVSVPAESVSATANTSSVLAGQSVILNYSVSPMGAQSDVEWMITEGSDCAQLSGNVLVINADAAIGTTVKVKASVGSVSSDELVFTVVSQYDSIVISSIEISAADTNIVKGNNAVISVSATPTDAPAALITWQISEGADYASIANNILSVSKDAPTNTVIKVKAVSGTVESNELVFTVVSHYDSIVISSIEISAADTDIVKGNNVAISVSATPEDAPAALITWQITEGADYASISNNILSVSKDAPTNTVIKVKAVSGTVESNELSFTVLPTQEEINATDYVISLSSSSITVDAKGKNSPILVGTVYNKNFDVVEGVNIVYSVTEGEQFLRIVQDGNNCFFVACGHGEATVKATIEGTAASATVSVDVILPPDAIDLPEVFKERTDISYSFSKVDSLPFVPVVIGSAYSCKDYVLTFMHSDGETGDNVAVYEDGAITFKKTGKVTVIVSSKSGSYVETQSAAYSFDINEGYNVYSFAELQSVVMGSGYNGQAINLVILEKPVAQYETDYKYGYDLVPVSALYDLDAKYAGAGDEEAIGAAIVNEILNGSADYGTNVYGDGNGNRIVALNRSIWVNGNNHKIDASQMRTFTLDEYNAYLKVCQKNGIDPNVYELISVIPQYVDPDLGEVDKEGVTQNVAHTVKFYNMEVVGNCPADYDGEIYDAWWAVVGCYTQGINIGVVAQRPYTTDYYVDCDSITASQFEVGIRVADAVGDSTISNIRAYNCYANGLRIMSSILKVENMSFANCGAFAIEISPKKSNVAGVNENENTKVTISGTVDVEGNLNNGDSNYFTNYKIAGYTIPQVVGYNVAQLNTAQQSYLMNGNGQFNFVSLMLNDVSALTPNYSEVLYPAYQEGGIIDISELASGEIDTEHQYIIMDVVAPNMGTVGKAIFYNMNYGK